MATNLGIDDRLLEQAQQIGKHKTKKETVNTALAEYVLRRRQQRVLSLFGTIAYDPKYDYKRARKLRAK